MPPGCRWPGHPDACSCVYCVGYVGRRCSPVATWYQVRCRPRQRHSEPGCARLLLLRISAGDRVTRRLCIDASCWRSASTSSSQVLLKIPLLDSGVISNIARLVALPAPTRFTPASSLGSFAQQPLLSQETAIRGKTFSLLKVQRVASSVQLVRPHAPLVWVASAVGGECWSPTVVPNSGRRCCHSDVGDERQAGLEPAAIASMQMNVGFAWRGGSCWYQCHGREGLWASTDHTVGPTLRTTLLQLVLVRESALVAESVALRRWQPRQTWPAGVLATSHHCRSCQSALRYELPCL
jgi:hypothetical protein